MATLMVAPRHIIQRVGHQFASAANPQFPLNVLPSVAPAFSARLWLAEGCSWYVRQLTARPLATKCATGGVLFSFGDIVAQRMAMQKAPTRTESQMQVSEKSHVRPPPAQLQRCDFDRTLKMTIWGGVFNTGLGHLWYNFVERIAGLPGPAGIVQRIAYDQLLWTPLIDVGFFTYYALASGGGLQGVRDELSAKYWPTLKRNWQVWPMVHCITYTLIPLQFRVFWVGCVGVGWSMFLSFMANDYEA